MLQEWPNAEAHEDLCRALMFRWRLAFPNLANDVAAFPCSCEERKPYVIHVIEHPAWCVLGDEPHPWHQCTIVRMVPAEKRS